MLSANSYSMSWAAAGNMSALSMPCSSISASRRSRLPNASDLWRKSAMNALRSSSVRPFSGLSRLSSIPGTTELGSPSAWDPAPAGPTLEVSPSIFCSSSVEKVTWLGVELRRLARRTAASAGRPEPSRYRMARSACLRVDVALEAVGRLVEVVVGVVDRDTAGRSRACGAPGCRGGGVVVRRGGGSDLRASRRVSPEVGTVGPGLVGDLVIQVARHRTDVAPTVGGLDHGGVEPVR